MALQLKHPTEGTQSPAAVPDNWGSITATGESHELMALLQEPAILRIWCEQGTRASIRADGEWCHIAQGNSIDVCAKEVWVSAPPEGKSSVTCRYKRIV
jgi:hypothetical protein